MKTPDHRTPGNPFPGLRPFRTDEHHLFFGREEQTSELLRLLREHRFIGVVGTSGSGKSSLVRAGLIPALHRGMMAQTGSTWEVVLMRPGGDPITNLARALVEADLYDPDDVETMPRLRATLSRSRFGLIEAVRQSEDLSPGGNLLVVVDQFEELFRFRQQSVESEETATAFVNLLLAASESANDRIYVAITMRSDYLGDCSEIPGLAEAVNRGEYLIPRLLRDQKRDAIEKPIGVGGARIAQRLVQRMLNQVGDDPDQLPVLQHALMRTWDVWAKDHAPDEPIDLRHFEATGGMDEALSRHADEVFDALPDDEHRRTCERLFKALTEKGPDNRGIRRPTRFERLVHIAGAKRETVLAVIEAFRCPGVTFIMPGTERELADRTVLDLSHESLMRVWRRLRTWVDEEAQSSRIFRRLSETAALWREGKAGLYRDPDLQIALSWRDTAAPNEHWAAQYGGRFDLASEFLDQSRDEAHAEELARESARRRELEQARALAEAEQRRARERERAAKKLKVLALGMGVVAIIAVIAFFQALAARRDADVQAKLAAERADDSRQNADLAARNEVAAREAAAELQRILVRSDFNQGSQLIEAGNASEGLAFIARSLRSDPNFSPAGIRTMSTLATGRFRLEEYPTIEQSRPITEYKVNRQEDLILTSDREVLAEGETAERFVFDLRTGERLYQVAGGAEVSRVKWSLDGKRLYAVDSDHRTIRAWDSRTGTEVWNHECDSMIDNFDFALADHPALGPLVAVRLESESALEILSAKSGNLVVTRFSREDAPTDSQDFSPDGMLHWSWYSNGVLVLRETASGQVLLETPPKLPSSEAWVTEDNRWLVAASYRDRSVGWWPIPEEGDGSAPSLPQLAGGGWISYPSGIDVRLLPSGQRLAVFARDNAQRRLHIDVYDLATREKSASFDVAPSSPGSSPGRYITWDFLADEVPRSHVLRFPIVAVIEEVSQNSVVVWDLESGEELMRIRTPWFLRDLELAPEGMRIATVSIDQKVMLWNLFSGEMLLPEPIDHEGSVTLAFDPSGAQLLTSVWPAQAIEFRDSRTGERLFEALHGQHFGRAGAIFSKAGDRVALYQRVETTSTTFQQRPTQGRFLVVDTALRPIIFEPLLRGGGSAPGLAKCTSDGHRIVVAGRERASEPGELRILDATTRETERTVTFANGVIASGLELTSEGRFAFVATTDARASLIDLETGSIVRELVLDGPASSIALSSDGHRAAAGTSDGKVRVFDLASGAPVGPTFAHGTTRIDCLRLNADGSLLVSGSEDFTFRIVDSATGEPRCPAIELGNVGLDVALLGDDHAVLVPFADSIPIIDLASGRVLHRLAHSEPCLTAAASTGGNTLATAGGASNAYASGEIRLWDWRTGRRLGAPIATRGQVRILEFSRDGALLASGTSGPITGAVRVWDVESGRPLTDSVRGLGPVASMSFEPRGNFVVAAWFDGSVRVIDLPPRATPKPGWLPTLVDAATGTRLLAGKQAVGELSKEERDRAREEVLQSLAATDSKDSEVEAHTRWLRWFFADPASRTLSPSSRVTLTEYIREKSSSSKLDDLIESLRLSPSSGVVSARIGLALASSAPSEEELPAPLRRYWEDVELGFADRAIALEPGNSEAWVLRAELLEKLGRREESQHAIERAGALETTGSANVAYLRALSLARERRWTEADAELDAALDAVVVQTSSSERRSLSAPLVGVLPALEPSRAGVDLEDFHLPPPIPETFEDFDQVSEGRVPDGWISARDAFGPAPADDAATMDDLTSDASPDWVVLDVDRHPNWKFTTRGEPGLIDGRVPTTLVENRVLFALSRQFGSPRPLRSIETRDFDLRGRHAVHLAFRSAYEQSTGFFGAVEYSIDRGATWLPAAYFLDARDVEYDTSGSIDAITTLDKPRKTLAWYIDENGELRGRSYGSFLRAKADPGLASLMHGRRDSRAGDSNRIEVFRLPAADDAPAVRVRFAIAGGPSGGSWAIDSFGLYEIPDGRWAKRPERIDPINDPALLAGIGLRAFLGATDESALSRALSTDDFLELSPAAPDIGQAQWIWTARDATSREVAFFRRSFEIEKPVRAAYLQGTCYEEFEASINGKRVATGNHWYQLTTAPVTSFLRDGRNTLAVRAANSAGTAGFLLRLEIAFVDGETREIATDTSWRVARAAADGWTEAKFDDSEWKPPHVLGPYGIGPWGRVFDSGKATDDERRAAALLVRRAARKTRDDPWVLLASAYVEAQTSSELLDDAIADARRALEIRALGPQGDRVLAALFVARGDRFKRDGNGDAAAVCYELAHVLFEAVSSLAHPSILGRLASVGLAAESRLLIPRGATWKYLDDGPYPDHDWIGIEFDDSSWREGKAALGYGDSHIKTTIRSGTSSRERRISSQFRASFDIDDPTTYAQLVIRLQRDDGAVVWLNGQQLLSDRMPKGEIGPTTLAATTASDSAETEFSEFSFFSPPLRKGQNVVAVEVHQATATSSDLGFDLEIEAVATLGASVSDFAKLESLENSLDLPPNLRALLWIGRSSRLRSTGDIGRSQVALENARRFDADSPRIDLEAALLARSGSDEDDGSSHEKFLRAVRGSLAIKETPSLEDRLWLPPHFQTAIEPLIEPTAIGLAAAAQRVADSNTLHADFEARALLELAASLATDHEGRIAVVKTWPSLNPENALRIADGALANLPPSPKSARAIRERRDWLRQKERAVRDLGRANEADELLAELLEPPPRPEGLDRSLIDLSAHYTHSLYDSRWHDDRNPAISLRLLPETYRPRHGVEFDLRGLIQLNSGVFEGETTDPANRGKDVNQMSGRTYPDEVGGIAVGLKASELDFLASTIWGQAPVGDVVARYVVRYADGTTVDIPVHFAEEITDWAFLRDELDLERVAWIGRPGGAVRHLTLLRWQNPSPEKTIASFDFVSGKKSAAPFLVAVTATGITE